MGKATFAVTPTLDSAAIRDQLELLLHSVHFRTSKRCQSLLKYVVEEALAGHYDRLKERTIGVQVFAREPAYDTNQDAVVRNAAVEVRKRLAQYYMDPAHENQIRINLPLGAYAPDFSSLAPPPAEAAEQIARRRPRRGWFIAGLAFCAAVAFTAAIVFIHIRFGPAAELNKFWAPLLDAPEAAQVCVGQPRRVFRFDGPRRGLLNENMLAGKLDVSVSPAEIGPAGKDLLYFRDGYAMARIAGLLEAARKPYHLRNDSTAPFSEVRRSPLILIGAFNNLWTMRLMSDLRYTFAHETVGGVLCKFILDRQNPNDRRWRMKADPMFSVPDKDYLIVTRVLDSTTERTVISVAGFVDYGTLAAGEFATDPAYLKEALRHAPSGWEKKNIQIVLQAKFIEGTPGRPEVLAMHFW